jgi:prepilin-type N-terminal cleavage/methylation domain-containing protein
MTNKKNQGFSLAELIIVIAVIAILGTGLIQISGVWDNWRLTKYSDLMENTWNKAKMQALSKGNVAGIEFYQLNGVYYAAIVSNVVKTKEPTSVFDLSTAGTVLETVELGKRPITMTVTLKNVDGENTIALSDNSSISSLKNVAAIAFNRGSGAIKPVTFGGKDSDYTKMTIGNDRKTMHYTIAYATGNIAQE